MQSNNDPFENQEMRRIQTFICLIPVVGFLPALWALYRRTGNRDQQNASRLAVLLTIGWILGYSLLGTAAQLSDSLSLTLPLLIMSSLLTSGYFLVNIWLMVRLWQRRSIRLPGLSQWSDRLP